MGTQQSRSGHGRQGSHQQSQQSDRRPQQERDLQRNKQSDRGQQQQEDRGHGQQGGQARQPEVQQSQLGGARDFEHKVENEGREQNRMQEAERRQMSQQNVQGAQPAAHERPMDALRGGGDRGEGSYAGTRQYDEAAKKFAESGRVDEAARAAAPKSPAEAREMQAAEAEGKRRAKGEDPALNRGATQPSGAPRPGREEG
jgi:hypothetical protein